jgi:hypothetical protein
VRPAPRGGSVEVQLPVSDPFARRGDDAGASFDAEPETSPPARRPRYKVRKYETLRSIARDTLNDSRRADEILELNAGLIDDPAHLVVGQEIELPEDARLGSRRAAP